MPPRPAARPRDSGPQPCPFPAVVVDPAGTVADRYFTSFQYSFFSSQASSVKNSRKAITGKPNARRCN